MKYDCLIIDDELAIAQATSEYLNILGMKSTYSTTATAGQAILNENEVALLLLDINLTSELWLELCRELRHTMQIPILFIRACQSDDDIKKPSR